MNSARLRLPLLGVAALALLAGMWAGLVRLGWGLPPLQPAWVASHGPLMLSAFLGSLVSLERAIALALVIRSRWPYAAPLLGALGGLALLVGLPDWLGRGLIVAAGLALAAIFLVIVRRQPNAAYATMLAGALAWLAGNLLWLAGQPLYVVAPWWVAFLVLTVAGERLELARVLLLQRLAQTTFAACAAAIVAGLCVSLPSPAVGLRLTGLGLAGLGGWLFRFDLARRTVRQTGLTRFIALCLLPGYLWLTVAGLAWLVWAEHFTAGPLYDAMLHAILLGFIFSMIFGHAPIILPAVTGRSMVYRSAFYFHLALLHAGLLLRVTGDLAGQPGLRQWGGLLNVLAILLFLANSALAMRTQPAFYQ